ncbi:alpha/beta hydrolase [Actinomadura sp. DC4]|uniref:alpha/beta fold hydrolase n=1 Tax=Actinomadura sp. DC4 TaxID=3055069 RepID=UPI0025B073DA|nr:alpha/beta hydrolase [Actinomadura sp. DC4]MDN3359160.1 alpha/beta hydrolase [Actinomadura sp. DC4]
MQRRVARYTLEGVHDAEVSVHPFSTEDDLGLELRRFRRADCDDVVLVLHGLTASSDMFIMPEHRNLVSFLLDSGFTDVWTLDFRMSARFPYDAETHRYSLDDIAHWDHPAALRELREHVGGRRVHVIAHCLGSVSFSMSLFGGALDGITSLVSNSVSLRLQVPGWSRVKLAVGPALTEYVLGLSCLDPRYGDAPVMTRGWMLSRAVSLFHRECDVRACHMESFMWGSGRPAMYSHDNLDETTHRRIADLLGPTGVHYFRHVRKMVAAGRVVRYDPSDGRHASLPEDYLARAADIPTRVLFLTGDRNHVFPGANIVCHEMLEKSAPGRHELEILPGYGHFDPFTGKNAHLDVFPRIVDFLKRNAA